MKTCTTCELPYSLDEFYKRIKGEDARCKSCTKAASRRDYAENHEKRDAQKREHRRLNPEIWLLRERKYRLKNRDKIRACKKAYKTRNPNQQRAAHLRKEYGITLLEYQEMLGRQNGVCAICSLPESLVKHGKIISLAVDHRHHDGTIRGLLCSKCNLGIGYLGDSPKLLTAAATYIRTTL